MRRDVDYIGVGPFFATQTPRDVNTLDGLAYLNYVVNNIGIPFVAIGGIKEHNIAEVASRGAKCIAIDAEIAGAAVFKEKIIAIRKILHHAEAGL